VADFSLRSITIIVKAKARNATMMIKADNTNTNSRVDMIPPFPKSKFFTVSANAAKYRQIWESGCEAGSAVKLQH
jgi:hypothetical protein